MGKVVKLDLTPREQASMRKAGFQRFASTGPKEAGDLWTLGCKSLQDLSEADTVKLYDRLGRMAGRWMVPCVEDVLQAAFISPRKSGPSGLQTKNRAHPVRGSIL